MDAKEAAPSQSPPDSSASSTSGTSSETQSSSDFDNTQNVVETNGTVVNPIENTGGVAAGGGGEEISGSDDDAGYVSGEEDFETAPENPIAVEEILVENNGIEGEEESGGEAFVDPPEFPMTPRGEESPVVEVIDDDVEKGPGSGIVGEVFDEEPLVVNSNEVVGSDEVLEDGSESVKVVSGQLSEIVEGSKLVAEEVDEKVEEVKGVDDEKIESSPLTASEDVGEANGVKVTTEGDSVVEAIQVDMPAPGVAVVGNVGENEKADESVAVADGPDQTTHNSELVDMGAVKLTSEGDSVVDSIDIDAPVPGVAVVGQIEEDGDAGGGTTVIPRSSETDRILEEVVDKEVVGVTGGQFEPLQVDNVIEDIQQEAVSADAELEREKEKKPETEIEKGVDYDTKENGAVVNDVADGVETVLNGYTIGSGEDKVEIADFVARSIPNEPVDAEKHMDSVKEDGLENGLSDKFVLEESTEVDAKGDADEDYTDGSASEGETDSMIFGSSEAAKRFIEELEKGGAGGGSHSGGESSQDHPQMIDGQIATDSDEEEGEEGKELFDSAALAALLKAAADGGSEGGSITITSQDGSRLFSVERPAGLGPSAQSLRPAPRPTRSNFFTSNLVGSGAQSDNNLSDAERAKLEKLQAVRVKFFRILHRLGLSADESVAGQVIYRLALAAGRQTGPSLNLEAAKKKALELETEGKVDLDFSVNILVLGKAGVGKSATINSIFGEEKSVIDAFQPATCTVKEFTGIVDGVKVRVFDTPGLKPSALDQGFNRSILSSAKKLMKKNPPDIVLYVDRLDVHTRDINDLPLLKTVTSVLDQSVWRNAIITLTHAASAPPDGPLGTPLSYEQFVTNRSHVIQQSVSQAVGDYRMMSPSGMSPVCLVENHPSCRKNPKGQKVLPNGLTWRPQLLLLCYSMKILSEANSISRPQEFDPRKIFGYRTRAPPLPYMLSSMLQSRPHPKLSSEQGGDNGELDVDLADLSDSDQEEEYEYDQLPPFKPLKKSQLAKLSKEQRNAYFDEYEYRVKLLQKKQWKEELKRMREMKKRGKDAVNDYGNYMDEEGDQDNVPAPIAVPLPDMAIPPSFDSDNPSYRFRMLEPTSQFLARPVLDTHGWDHDCGYDGVNVEQSLTIASQFPAVVSVQVTKDKKEFNVSLDSAVSAKHGEKGSSMAGFDIQPIGKQLAYVLRGETKFKNLKKNQTAAGISVTFLGENLVTGFKVEDQIHFNKQYSLIANAGTARFQSESAYGANIEIQRRELDYPIGQVQSTVGLSMIRWRGDISMGLNSLAQFSVGRGSKVAVRAGINNKMSGQVTVRTSSSEHLSLVLAAVIPAAISIYKKLYPEVGEKYSIY